MSMSFVQQSEDVIRNWVNQILGIVERSSLEFIIQYSISGFYFWANYYKNNIVNCTPCEGGIKAPEVYRAFRHLPLCICNSENIRVKCLGVTYKNGGSAVPIAIAYDLDIDVLEEAEKVSILRTMGFTPVETYICCSINEIIAIYKSIRDKQLNKYPYQINGLILRVNNRSLQKKIETEKNMCDSQIIVYFDK